ncbi:MAG: DUF3570 domain-containing protein, partial [Polyangia bacterium]
MRLQLGIAVAALLLCGSARADQVVIRGNYWRDRNTRVVQPEIDISKELPSGTSVGAHYLLDTITSASVAAGVIRDKPFTELRNEVGFRLGQRLGPTQHTVSYSYSGESDYWAHTLSVASNFDFFQKNSTLGLVTTYGTDTIAQRQGATIYNRLGGLQTFGFIASWTQIVSKYALLVGEYDIKVQGFGSAKGKVTGEPDANTGFQSNAYRSVVLGGSPAREVVPFQRIRQSFSGSLHLTIPTGVKISPYLGLRPSYRYYSDDWSIHSSAVELRMYFPVGPVELRVTGRYYTQKGASFYTQIGGTPNYEGDASRGLPCTGCRSSASHGATRLYYTADPKLSPFSAVFLEFRVLLKLEPVFRRVHHALPRWLSEGLVEVTYGHYFNDRLPQKTFGDA